MTTYHAYVEQDERYWLIHVPEVERYTQARHLGEVELMARDLVTVMLDVDPDSFELEVTLKLPAGAEKHLENARRLREEAARANSEAAKEARAAARLLAKDLSLRDVGRLLGISRQRAHQLVSS